MLKVNSVFAMVTLMIVVIATAHTQGVNPPNKQSGAARADEYVRLDDPDGIAALGLKIKIQMRSVIGNGTEDRDSGDSAIDGKVLSVLVGIKELVLTTDEVTNDSKGAWVVTKNYGRIKISVDSVGRLSIWLTGPQRIRLKDLYDGRSPLMLAASVGNVGRVTALIAKGADVKAANGVGETALSLAASGGHVDCVTALIAKGADVSAKDVSDFTALTHAAFAGHVDCVKALIAKGADVNAKAYLGVTPLMIAAGLGHVDCVKALIAARADINAKSSNGSTALVLAADHADVVAILRAAGANE